ncbi:hypothetical protein ACPOM7_17790 [Peribacillus castrilensis]|uniref:Uncharacterized protein n=1 Tax=Peribacillus simplex TaxID=1478 RepID=A0AAN2PKN2_9BACI|nr:MULTISPECIES: hypothetical protein [Bacillaceae]MBL3641754.1 hypothetical protein [Bacillus sp. RHFB]MCP1092444.1 hypothetical protein [Bacillaceae bacterium OS4b]QYF84261.1 hypothetical protein KY492_08445 [Brevibacterium sp. PAMC21349]MBD8591283.1 hypothetical protein [Peribacillus simplex]MCF7624224.1 hypothetical protein [Peribacillus frigoritolerans]
MKKTVLAFTVAGALVGLGGGYAIGFHNADEMQDKKQDQKIIAEINRLAKIKEMPVIQLDKQTSEVYMGKERRMANEGEENIITETFEISEIENGHIRGEKIEGKGEGIYYQTEVFTTMGFHPNYGDIFRVGWEESDYENKEWDKVVVLEQLK